MISNLIPAPVECLNGLMQIYLKYCIIWIYKLKNICFVPVHPFGFITVLVNAVSSICEDDINDKGKPLRTGLSMDWIQLNSKYWCRKLVYDGDVVSDVMYDEKPVSGTGYWHLEPPSVIFGSYILLNLIEIIEINE